MESYLYHVVSLRPIPGLPMEHELRRVSKNGSTRIASGVGEEAARALTAEARKLNRGNEPLQPA